SCPARSRARNLQSTEASNPESVSSNPKAYFQSIRPRTASAAWRSETFSANCKTVTNAKRQGASAGCPRRENSLANNGSLKTCPSVSRRCIASVPWGKAARATRVVSSGMDAASVGWSDISNLLTWLPQFSLSFPHSSIRQQYPLLLEPQDYLGHKNIMH